MKEKNLLYIYVYKIYLKNNSNLFDSLNIVREKNLVIFYHKSEAFS